MTSNSLRFGKEKSLFQDTEHPRPTIINLEYMEAAEGKPVSGLRRDTKRTFFVHRVLEAYLSAVKPCGKASVEMGSLQM